MKTRREFIRDGSFLLAALTLAPTFSYAFFKAQKKIGLQLYTLRDIIGKDIKGIIEKVAKAGFKEVETYGYTPEKGFWGMNTNDFKKLLDDNGLSSPSGHFGFEDFINSGNPDDLLPFIEAANILKSEYVVLPWLSEHYRNNVDNFKTVAEKLNKAGELCKSNGLKVAYHNHGFEFKKFGNRTGYDILLTETDKKLVDFELDLYWCEFAKNDPISLFKKYPHRFKMWHIKDMDKTNKKWNTEIGKGVIDFNAIFAEAKLSGVKHLYLEQETNYQPDYIESINTSFNYISKNLL